MCSVSRKDPRRISRKATQYSTIKYWLTIAETLYLLVLLFVLAGSGTSKILAESVRHAVPGWSVLPVYTLVLAVSYYILSFPFTFYHSFLLEHQFGLSRQSLGGWFFDQLKSESISYLLLLALLSAFYAIFRNFPSYWWLMLAGVWILFSVVLARLAPVVIIPLFYKYSPVDNAAQREAIMRLSQAMKIPVMDVLQIDASTKTSKANAAFTGWGASRRVILTDTLRREYSTAEIEAIIAHEFAHYKQNHLIKLMAFGAVTTMGGFYLVSLLADTLTGLFGFWSLADLAALPVILTCLIIYGIMVQPLSALVSRHFERNADRMALSFTRRPQAFISAMEKLAGQNLADRRPHPVIKFFFFDHPPIDERIAMARAFHPGS